MIIASHKEERWTRRAAEWNPQVITSLKVQRRTRRQAKRWEDDINDHKKIEEDGATRSDDLECNCTWQQKQQPKTQTIGKIRNKLRTVPQDKPSQTQHNSTNTTHINTQHSITTITLHFNDNDVHLQYCLPSGTTAIAVSYCMPPWRQTEDVVSVICIAILLQSVFEQTGDQRLILCAGPLDTWQSSHQHLSLSYLRSSKSYPESVPTVTTLRKLSDARTWVSALPSLPFLLIPSQKSQRTL